MLAVVVFPLVALTRTEPRESCAASDETAVRSSRSRSFPGRLVPPPRRLNLERRPAIFASAIFTRSTDLRLARGGGEHAHGARHQADGRRQAGEQLTVGVDVEGAARGDLDFAGAQHTNAFELD